MRNGYKLREMLFLSKSEGLMILMTLHIFRHHLSQLSGNQLPIRHLFMKI